jgi:hypothetical protein
MALLNQYVQNHGQMGGFFDRVREAQAPSKFTHQFLKDIGFTSSNYRAYVPLLKGLGFLSEDGTPKPEYMALLDPTQWRAALARAVKRSYSDIFVMKAKPGKADKAAILGKYKTTYNVNDVSADRAANTFLALLDLSDEGILYASENPKPADQESAEAELAALTQTTPQHVNNSNDARQAVGRSMDLCYNIQIHLPPTKDIEVYNAIFKSLREHFLD